MRTMRRILCAVMLVAAFAVPAAIPATAAAKTCSAGYVKGVIDHAQKCLRRGEFCSRSYAVQYHRYGFNCIDVSGYYRLEPR
jgi:hypothetical protein